MRKTELNSCYVEIKPKTKAEEEEQRKRIEKAYDILFEAMLEDEK